ncbi:unnamed protein product [Arabis nemorensis]|uniref:Uncharacterized protein n=1 Tax=Arabis nemorensis TaxID=586526 RepID=A0A565AUC6_9BRAS|nr:unnamed protein product [Arabis nemorensis]
MAIIFMVRIDEYGSQDDRESDGSLSSPASQGNEEFGTKDPSGMVKGAAKEISGDAGVRQGLGPKSGNGVAVERGTDYEKNSVEKSTSSSSEHCTHTVKNVACQNACGNSASEIAPVVDSVKPVVSLSKVMVSEKSPAASVSKVVVSEKSEHVETSTQSNLVKRKSDVNEEKPSLALEKDNGKVVTLPRPAAETSKMIASVRESEVPVSSEDKRLLLPGPPAVRTSWLSCCGLFDAMTGSDR